jgi:Protein of unknown function (DUF2510)
MRLLGRDTSSEGSRAAKDRRASRAAWYRDPFGVGDERWWDGTRWSREVRGSATSAESNGRSPGRPTERRPLEADAEEDAPADGSNGHRDGHFPASIGAVGEQQLRLVSSPRKPGTHRQLLTSRGRAGSISVYGGQLARLSCAHGAWFLKRSARDAQALTIESADRRQAGSYLRRRWRPGGTIKLVDGTEVELRRSRPGRWKVESAEDRECLAEVRRSRHHELKVTVHALPADPTNASMILLASCALLMLPAGVD